MFDRARHPLVVLAAALVVLPFAMTAVGLTEGIATKLAIFALVGLGFNLLLGYTGLVSFGHSLFFGLGAYAAALSQIHLFPTSFWLPLLFSTGVSGLAGLVVGFLILRRRGVYFALLSLAFAALGFYVVFRWTSFTGGENGLRGITRPATMGLDFNQPLAFYYLVAAFVLLGAIMLWRLVHSPLGRVFLAIRENELRCRFLGYRVVWYRLLSFTISALVVGLGGGFFAYLMYFVSADLVHVVTAGEILAMAVIGGSGNFLGPTVGAVFYILFRDWLSAHTESWQLWFGLLFIGFILFSPDGLMGIGERLLAPFRRDRERAAAMAARRVPEPSQEVPAFLRSTGPAPTLTATGVVKRFGPFTAVAGVDIEIGPGEIKAVIGPNGAGKTTLFNVLSGLYQPQAGTVVYDGKTLHTLPTEAFPRLGIARSFQVTNLFENLSVGENIRLAVQARHPSRFNPWSRADRVPEVVAETQELMRFTGLAGLDEVLVADLSGGGKRLLEIGLALASCPRVLLLDEPLAGLAAAERDRIAKLILTLSGQMAILMVEHDIDLAFDIARHIIVMHDGRVLADGTPEEVRNHPEVQRVYLGRGTAGLALPEARPLPEAQAPLLKLEAVNTFYGSSHILHDVSLEIRPGEIVGLLGRNGAGKSTTIKTIMGVAPARSGRVVLGNDDVTGRSPEAIARAGVGYVPQGRRLFGNLTVAQNLELGRLRRRTGNGVHWDDEQVFACFPKLKQLRDRPAGVLSGGEQQMVAIARALVGNVHLVMLDEPFEGLAPAVTDEVFEAVSGLRHQIPILIVEHDLDRVLALADRVYVLDRGSVAHEGPARPLLIDLDYRKKVLWL
jgi:ABC-type branched-subunit amino acid transport system ATPase component/ABC-type branched-subunit amino acid transport system permease subunit